MGSELLELVAAERCEGRQYKQGQKWLRKVHGQQVLEWMLEGLSRYVLFKILSTMILGTVKVQGELFAESGVGPIFLLTTTVFCHCEKWILGWMNHCSDAVGHFFYVFIMFHYSNSEFLLEDWKKSGKINVVWIIKDIWNTFHQLKIIFTSLLCSKLHPHSLLLQYCLIFQMGSHIEERHQIR